MSEPEKVELELEKLKLIAEYYDIPLAAFFMSTDEWKELKTKEGTRMKAIRKELEELEKAMERLERRIHDDERISTESTAKVMKRLDVVERDIIDIRSEIAHISKIRGDKQKMEEE